MQFGHKDTRTADELAKLGYEREDVGLKTIAVSVFWFFVFTIVMGVVTAAIYQFIVPSGFGPSPSSEKRTKFPAAPRLQDDIRVKTDIYDLRKHEDAVLSGADGKSVPIDEAIDQAAAGYGGATEQDVQPLEGNPEPVEEIHP